MNSYDLHSINKDSEVIKSLINKLNNRENTSNTNNVERKTGDSIHDSLFNKIHAQQIQQQEQEQRYLEYKNTANIEDVITNLNLIDNEIEDTKKLQDLYMEKELEKLQESFKEELKECRNTMQEIAVKEKYLKLQNSVEDNYPKLRESIQKLQEKKYFYNRFKEEYKQENKKLIDEIQKQNKMQEILKAGVENFK